MKQATFTDGICRVCNKPCGKGFTCCGSICLETERHTADCSAKINQPCVCEPAEHVPTLQNVVDYLGAQAINGIGQFDAYWRTWYGNGFALAFDIKSKLGRYRLTIEGM